MKVRKGNRLSKAALARLDAERREHGITLEAVAAEAAKTSKTKTCSVPNVSKTFTATKGYTNANVVDATRRLIAAAREKVA